MCAWSRQPPGRRRRGRAGLPAAGARSAGSPAVAGLTGRGSGRLAPGRSRRSRVLMLLFVVNKLVNDARTYITVFSSGRRYQAAKSFSKVNICRGNGSLWDIGTDRPDLRFDWEVKDVRICDLSGFLQTF